MVNPDGFLMIEPKNLDEEPIVDSITRKVAALSLKKKNKKGIAYRGFHICVCGAASDNREWEVTINGKKYQTNSLMVHYIACHRSEVPADQLALIESLTEETDPCLGNLQIQAASERIRRVNAARGQSKLTAWPEGDEVTDEDVNNKRLWRYVEH